MLSMNRSALLNAFAAICALSCALPAHANVTLLDKDDWKVGMYGFAESDAIFDSTRSFTEVIGNVPAARPGTLSGDNGRTQFSIRNSRLGFTVAAPKAGDWATRGVMEFDFLGFDGGTAVNEAATFNNPNLRARHFYLQAESNGWQLLAGQYWTLFGWQPNYFLATLSVAPVSGMVYERTAQFTAIKNVEVSDTNKVSVGLSITRPAQRDSQVPGLDAGVRWAWSGRKSGFGGMTSAGPTAQPLSIGISGRLNEFEFNGTSDTTSTTHQLGSALAIDTLLPIIASNGDDTGNTLTLTGEFTTGQGYGESFPGWTGGLPGYAASSAADPNTRFNIDAGQFGFDPNNGITIVHLLTFNLQLQYHLPTDWMTFVTAGYGMIYANNIDSLTGGNNPVSASAIYDRNSTAFINVGHNLTKQLRVAAEYDYVHTTYADGVTGHDNRIQASAFFYF